MTMLAEDLRRTLSTVREKVDAALDRIRPDQDNSAEQSSTLTRPLYRGPALDVEETDNEIIIQAELPGLRPEDVSVEVTPDRVILRGEKRMEHREDRRGMYVVERRYGAFLRAVPLPYEIDPDHVEARYHDGVLTLTLPKTESSKGRKVNVSVNGG